MGLLALPNDILLLVCGLLPPLPAIRLGNSAACSTDSLSPTSIYFALLRKEVDTFTKLCKEYQRKLPDDDAIYYCSDSRFTAENQHLETLKDCLCASVYVLVVARAETGQEWWAPLTGLASGLAAASDSLFRRSYVTGRHIKRRQSPFRSRRKGSFKMRSRKRDTRPFSTCISPQGRMLGLGLAEMSHGRSPRRPTILLSACILAAFLTRAWPTELETCFIVS
ncbi:hypothetical protein BCR44DRAFT_1423037 [Catenaria anguillulae PL171]|uniref:F-box domain-containing protein n=1 Tax=Catenaria anguillulae PL171 TaxID=765915 RepID=A0A1Y2I651_9FUNG|nr:hypothetical protein BCR44DRAFT_1423037 [Catenaria anguillulae PL171]